MIASYGRRLRERKPFRLRRKAINSCSRELRQGSVAHDRGSENNVAGDDIRDARANGVNGSGNVQPENPPATQWHQANRERTPLKKIAPEIRNATSCDGHSRTFARSGFFSNHPAT